MKLINKKRHIIRRAAQAVFILLFILLLIDNVTIHTTYTAVPVKDLPDSFRDYRIVQVSDLHNNLYGADQSYLISKVRKESPDIIVITGDLIDRNTTDLDNAMAFVSRAVETAPVFYVSGNHESDLPIDYPELLRRMKEAGVVILENESVTLRSKQEECITLAGIADPEFDMTRPDADIVDEEIRKALSGTPEDRVTILLSHRPELISIYAYNKLDLVLTGHAHGGQVRLPFIGPLYSPSEGLFPKYTSGLYSEGDTKMYVSRGIGNGIAPFRINDGPELSVIILK